jgi:hypothetical protein
LSLYHICFFRLELAALVNKILSIWFKKSTLQNLSTSSDVKAEEQQQNETAEQVDFPCT